MNVGSGLVSLCMKGAQVHLPSFLGIGWPWEGLSRVSKVPDVRTSEIQKIKSLGNTGWEVGTLGLRERNITVFFSRSIYLDQGL